MELLDLEKCDYSPRNGYYGGAAGDKDGILLNGEYWICKYPKPTIGLKGAASLSPYSLTPLSEYLGSQIYHLLGYPVHETKLGVRDGMLVVACKDFCGKDERLFEIRTIKNVHLAEMRQTLGIDLHETGDDHLVDINELFVHFEKNPELKNVNGLAERFWDQVVIDGLLGNNDRNNGNWGIVIGENGKRIAPIFDNGASFYPKKSDFAIEKALNLPKEEKERNYLNVITPFSIDGEHHLNYTHLLSMGEMELPAKQALLLRSAIKRNAALVRDKKEAIIQLFEELPVESNGLQVLTKARKTYYLESFLARLEFLLARAGQL